MTQLENYLSGIQRSDIRNIVILPETQEFLHIIMYVSQYMHIQGIYCVMPDHNCFQKADILKYVDNINFCTAEEFNNEKIQIDIILFDYKCKALHELLLNHNVKYLIGRMLYDEDYFSLWENSRDKAEHIYIEQKGSTGKEYEILEWTSMDSGIELSVVVPVYNVEKYLPECIQSLVAWEVPYVEFLFIDDGSCDNSAEIIKEYMNRDSRIKLISKQNGGCASARNRGINEAKGRYIGFVDSDDFVEHNMFRELIKRAILGNYDLTYCGYQEYCEDTGEIRQVKEDCLSGIYSDGTYDEAKVSLLAVRTRVAIWRCLYKKSILDKYKIRFNEDLKRFDDLPFRVEYTFAAGSAVCVPMYLYNYRIGRKGQDTLCTDERLYVHFSIFEYLNKIIIRSKDKYLSDLLQAVMIQTHSFGLAKIEKKYRRNYAKRAKAQLKEQAGFIRNVVICLIYAGRGNIGWLTRLWLGMY